MIVVRPEVKKYLLPIPYGPSYHSNQTYHEVEQAEKAYQDFLRSRVFLSQPRVDLRIPIPTEERVDLSVDERYMMISNYAMQDVVRKQGSDIWTRERNQRPTGSVLFNLAGGWLDLDGLQRSIRERYLDEGKEVKSKPATASTDASSQPTVEGKTASTLPQLQGSRPAEVARVTSKGIEVKLKENEPCVSEIPQDSIKEQDDEISKEISTERMKWGSDHEIDAVATIIKGMCYVYHYILRPTCLKRALFNASHLQTISDWFTRKHKRAFRDRQEAEEWFHLICISPDFELVKKDSLNADGSYCVLFVGEIKCKYGDRFPSLYDSPPFWYYLQTQGEILTSDTAQGCLFVSWSPAGCITWMIPRDEQIWNLALPAILESHWHGVNKTLPVQLPRESARIRAACLRGMARAKRLGYFKPRYSKQTMKELDDIDLARYQQWVAQKVGTKS